MTPQQRVVILTQRYKQIEIEFVEADKFARSKLLAETSDIAQKIFELGYSLPKLIYKRQLKERL